MSDPVQDLFPESLQRFLHADKDEKRLCRQVGLGELGNLAKSGHIRNGQIRQNLSIQLHAGLLQTLDKLTIREPVELCCRINTGDPETAKPPPSNPPVPIGIVERLLYGLPCRAIQSSPTPDIAFRQFKDLFFPLPLLTSSLSSWHVLTSLIQNAKCKLKSENFAICILQFTFCIARG